MRVALTGSYPPPHGGLSASVKQMAILLRRDGHRVRVFTHLGERANREEEVYWYPLKTVNWKKNLLFKVREYRPELLHCHSSNWQVNIAVVSRALSIPLIHQIYGERFPQQFQELGQAGKLLVKWSLHQARQVIASSAELAEFVRELGVNRDRVHYIPCLLPMEEVPSASQVPSRVAGLLQNGKRIVIVSSGYYLPYYGFSLIPEASARLKKRGIDFVWLVAGEGKQDELEAFRQLIDRHQVSDRVIPIGDLGRSALIALLSASNIYVRTKHSDSFGIAIAEAHQLGCHCIFGDNNPYFQGDGERLLSYRTGDIDSLTELLLRVIPRVQPKTSGEPRGRFSELARDNYRRIMSIYRGVLAG